jgi:SAM-dependent methyltransferase
MEKQILQKIEECLDNLLLNRITRVDRFDGGYLDDFHFILKENYDIRSIQDNINKDFNTLKSLFPIKDMDLKEYGNALKNISGLNTSKYSSAETTSQLKDYYGYNKSQIWNNVVNIKKDNNNVDELNKLQVEYSIISGGNNRVAEDLFWVREGLTEHKDKLFHEYGGKDKKVLCIGPRWIDEILFIRSKFGSDAIGLDLFSNNEELVTVGDMHDMPFPDNSFDVVYQKNTFNKAYDIRKCLAECVRVLKPGGIIISDECLAYTIGVNEIARTSIHRNSWYTAYLKDNIDKVVADIEVDPKTEWIELGGLYAAKIKK